MTPPAISVVVPCRNEAATLRGCLDALGQQDFPPDRFELIVVDGGSTDGSRELATAAGARVLRDGAQGPSGARNVGVRAARAPIVAFTDADCIPRADWLTRLAEVFAEDASITGVAGALRMSRRTLMGRLEDIESRAYYRGVITSNVAYVREAILDVGGFDESLCCAEDYDLAWRIQDGGRRVVHDPRPVVVHDPPEVNGALTSYLRKHFWYARNDVPANLRAVRRVRRAGSASVPGSAGAVNGVAGALADAGLAAAVAALVAAPGIGALGLATAGYSSYRRVARAARLQAEVPRMVAVATARRIVRGLGTLTGFAELARPSKRRLLTAPELVTLAPAAPRAARPPADAPQRLPT